MSMKPWQNVLLHVDDLRAAGVRLQPTLNAYVERSDAVWSYSFSLPISTVTAESIASQVATVPNAPFSLFDNFSLAIQVDSYISSLFSGQRARAEAAAAGQWHIANTTPGQLDLNIGTIWDDYTGRGVKIGVYDSGIEASHPDLDGNYNAKLEFAYDNPAPDYTATGVASNDAHGTAVAGIIAAEQNGAGTVGIAYGAKVTSVDTVGAATVSDISSLLAGMSRFDIVNRSSGVNSQFQGDATDFAAYENAVMTGRGGRGTIIVESAGNERVFGDLNGNGTQQSSDAGPSDANSDSANNGHFAIVVGAVDQTGRVDSYSNPGANLLVSAFGTPGNVVTTDLVGANGYRTTASQPAPNEINGGDYTGGFNGTSAATPMVSGIVALMLEANPLLGWRDVQNILAISARHVGSEMGAGPTAGTPEKFTWNYNQADNWNGGGMHFSNDYGYGLVDAHAAVRLAESWTLQSTSANQQIGVGYKFPGKVNITEANTVPNEFKITIADNISTESIGLWLNINHPRMSDLKIEIRSPEGTWSTLTDRTGLGGADFGISDNKGWTFTSNAFRGEMAKGEWTIRVWDQVDAGAGDNGTISGLILRTYGSADTVNDQLYYTDEYGKVWSEAMAKGDYGRLQITDRDGGIDTINAAATTTDAHIDLNQGGITLIAGGYAQVAMGSLIENAFGGDGNDSLYGNELTNLLDGNRGNDSIYGRGGADSLSGDKGDDHLVGGAGGDVINGGAGRDTASYEGSWRGVTVSLGDQQGGTWNGTAWGGDASGDKLYQIENLTGSSFRDYLTGNKEDNVLNGGGGADVMAGGAGNDTYVVDNVSDVVDEEIWVGTGGSGLFQAFRLPYADAGGDHDLVITSLSTYDLSANSTHNLFLTGASGGTLFGQVEDLTFSGTGKFTGIGNNANNIIRGGASGDLLIGGGGNDTLYGGVGNDRYDLGLGDDRAYIDNGTAEGGDVVDGSAGGYDSVFADNLTIASGLHLNLYDAGTAYTPDVTSAAFTSAAIGVDYVEGNAGDDTIDASRLTGGIFIVGGAGEDTIIGGRGNDLLVGGDQHDTFQISGAVSAIGTDTIWGGSVGGSDSYADLVDFSHLAGSVSIDFSGNRFTATDGIATVTSMIYDVSNVKGSDFDDLIIGDSDGNSISGGAGSDTLRGGGGNDLLEGGEGVDSFVLADDWNDDVMVGDFENGREVIDVRLVSGLSSFDQLSVTSADFFGVPLVKVVFEGKAIYFAGLKPGEITADDFWFSGKPDPRLAIVGTEGDDRLEGNGLDNQILGLGGNDIIDGGEGADTLIGGAGDDTIIVDNADLKIDGGTGFDYLRAGTATDAVGLKLDLADTSIEYVDASNGADIIEASGTTAGTITEIDGHRGDDRVIDGPGEVWFNGGDGTDAMAFSGNLADYTITPVATWWAGWTMISNNATGEVDWVIDVEMLEFDDQTIDDPTASSHILGTSGDDVLNGTEGADVLKGGDGADELRAGAGNDALYIDNADLVIDGGEGWDVVYATEAAGPIGLSFAMAGTSIEEVWSGMGDDVIDTRGLEQRPEFYYGIVSRSGNDRVIAGDAAITFDGGTGHDTLVLAGNRADYTVAVAYTSELGDTYALTNSATGIVDYVTSVEVFEFADETVAQSHLLI